MNKILRHPLIKPAGKALYGVLLISTVLYSLVFSGFTNQTLPMIRITSRLQGPASAAVSLLCAVCVLLEAPRGWRRALFAALLLCMRVFGAMVWQSGMLLNTLLLAVLSDLGTEKSNARCWLASHGLYVLLMAALLLTGSVQDVPTYHTKSLWIFRTGHSFGMGHPNSFAVFFMSTWMMLWVLFLPKRWWGTVLYYLVGGVAVGALTLSRTAMALMILFPALYYLTLALSRTRHPGCLRAAAALPFSALAVTLAMGLLLSRLSRYYSDGAFWMRFSDISVLKQSGLSLFGYTPVTDGILDNMYIWLLVYCGAVPTLCSLILYGYMLDRLAVSRRVPLFAVAVLFVFYGLMENAAAYPIYFFVPMLALAPREKKAKRLISRNTPEQIHDGLPYGRKG